MRTLLAALLLLAAAAPARAEVRVEVLGLKGELKAGGRRLARGEVLTEERELELSAGGKAVLRVGAGVVLLKGPARFRPEPEGLTLSWGSLLSALKRRPGPWRVRTPTAVAAVRGTEFFVRQPRKGPTYLCLCRGRLEVSPAGGDGAEPLTLKSRNHKAALLERDKEGGLSRTPSGLEDHTDRELASLKGLLGD